MENRISISLLGLLLALPLSVSGAAKPTITLKMSDGWLFEVPKEIALLSKHIIRKIESHPKAKIYTLEELGSKKLEMVLPLMDFAHSIQNKPFKERLQMITAEIKRALVKQDLEMWENLSRITGYLDIDLLRAPLANGMIQYIYSAHKGNREGIKATISSLNVSHQWAGLLAKYWYLNYGSFENYILPDFDYGFSIEELATYNKLPPIIDGKLKLHTLRINDLTGLDLIPNIASVKKLNLANNRLATLPEKIFRGLNELRVLYLDDNKLTTLPKNIFNELNQLSRLYLANNPLDPAIKERLKAQLGKRVKF